MIKLRSSESTFFVEVSAEISMKDLIKLGSENFAQGMRKALEEELKPILAVDWKGLRSTGSPETDVQADAPAQANNPTSRGDLIT